MEFRELKCGMWHVFLREIFDTYDEAFDYICGGIDGFMEASEDLKRSKRAKRRKRSV